MKILKKIENALQLESFHLRHELERISSEIRFAGQLAELHPEHAGKWKRIINEAVKIMDENSSVTGKAQFAEAVRKAENIMAPIGEIAKKYTVRCVGHAHIDMNWMWSWPETVAVANDTFSTVLKLMEEYPDFVFSQSQASIYAIIEKYNPEMLKKIQERVREGRWEVTASHWVEGDKNMSGGEALARHLLYTRRYMKNLFNLNPEDVTIDWSPDTFGHSANIPSYLRKGGVKYCYLFRPGKLKGPLPEAFLWKSSDGSKVLVKNDMLYGYNGKVSSKVADDLMKFVKLTGGFNSMFVYGIGDHGGGPTRCDLNKILDMDAWPVFPGVKFATAHSFFEILEKEFLNIPSVEGELNVEFTGCYTTQTLIKKANRYSENHLADAEFAAVASWRLEGQSYPHEQFEKNWRDCLFNHFHDILPGSGVRDTRHYTMGLFQNIMADTGMIETLSYRQIASLINTEEAEGVSGMPCSLPSTFYKDALGAGAGIGSVHGSLSAYELSNGSGKRPFVIFNPTAVAREEVIEVTIWDNPVPGDSTALKNKQFAVRTHDGKLFPAQFISEGASWGHRYVKIAFPVEVGGYGYALYTVLENETAHYEAKLKPVQTRAAYERAGRFGCENEYILFEINPRTGGILRLHDKKSGVDIISPENQAAILEYSVERPHGMSAWRVDFSNKPEAPEIKSISYTSDGLYKTGIKVETKIHNSNFDVTYEMQENNPLVFIHVKGKWLETGNENIGCPALRMPFSFNLDSSKTSYEIPFGAIERNLKNDEEVPAMQWAKVSGLKNKKNLGCVLLNDCKHGHAFDDGTLRVSLIRSAYMPDPFPEIGEHEINLALLPFSGNLSDTETTEYGHIINHKLRVAGTGIHNGKLPSAGQFMKISGDNVIVSGIKKAEDGNAVIMRFYEMEGKDAKFRIAFDKAMAGKVKSACAVDLMERVVEENKIRVTAQYVEAGIPAHGIISLRIDF